MLHQVGLAGLGDPHDPRGLVPLHVDGHGLEGEELPHAGDGDAHHRTAHVVGVVVGGQGPGEAHAVGVEDPEEVH